MKLQKYDEWNYTDMIEGLNKGSILKIKDSDFEFIEMGDFAMDETVFIDDKNLDFSKRYEDQTTIESYFEIFLKRLNSKGVDSTHILKWYHLKKKPVFVLQEIKTGISKDVDLDSIKLVSE